MPLEREVLWQGPVKIDQSFVKHLSKPNDHEDFQIYTIRDSRYRKEDNGQFDNTELVGDFPNMVTVIVKGKEILDYMQCSAFKDYEYLERSKGFFEYLERYKEFFFKSGVKKRTAIKGFVLEPLSDTKTDDHACLASIQFDNEESGNEVKWKFMHMGITERAPTESDFFTIGGSFALEELGLVGFASGSHSSNITFSKDSKKSSTIVFVASDSKPFTLLLHSKDETKRLTYSSAGLKAEEIMKKQQSPSPDSTPPTSTPKSGQSETSDALKILNTRLARGELTIFDYEELRKVIEHDRDHSYTDNWA